MNKDIEEVLRYFAFFSYPPTKDQIYCFLPRKAEKGHFYGAVSRQLRLKKIESQTVGGEERYVLPGQSSLFKIFKSRFSLTQQKLDKVQTYLRLLSSFPQIQLIAYSGSIALSNADKRGDVDLFIVTKAGQLWTGRFLAVFLAQLLGLRGEKLPHRVCLNLFFDEKELYVPRFKKNAYVAHEILQMNIISNKNTTYERLRAANRWVEEYFPNNHILIQKGRKKGVLRLSNNPLIRMVEFLVKKIQLKIIYRRLQEEIITENQLWLFTNDYQKKLPPHLIT